MRICAAFLFSLFLLGSICFAQDNSLSDTDPSSSQSVARAARASREPKIDPAKEADVRRLLDVAGSRTMAVQMMAEMEKNIRPLLTNSFPPGEYREKLIELFFEKFHSKADSEKVLDLAVPVYDKYLSDEDVKGLIQFYSTPLGQKAVNTLPKLVSECTQAGQKWGEQLGRESMMEVLSEHPELKTALQETQKAAQAQ
jgi:uncharacterized protein